MLKPVYVLAARRTPLGSFMGALAGVPAPKLGAAAIEAALKERGLVSPYLRSFVVARINPLRWIKGEPPPLEDVLKTMRPCSEVQCRED